MRTEDPQPTPTGVHDPVPQGVRRGAGSGQATKVGYMSAYRCPRAGSLAAIAGIAASAPASERLANDWWVPDRNVGRRSPIAQRWYGNPAGGSRPPLSVVPLPAGKTVAANPAFTLARDAQSAPRTAEPHHSTNTVRGSCRSR